MLFDIHRVKEPAYAQELGINYELDMDLPFAQIANGVSQKIYITGCGRLQSQGT